MVWNGHICAHWGWYLGCANGDFGPTGRRQGDLGEHLPLPNWGISQIDSNSNEGQTWSNPKKRELWIVCLRRATKSCLAKGCDSVIFIFSAAAANSIQSSFANETQTQQSRLEPSKNWGIRGVRTFYSTISFCDWTAYWKLCRLELATEGATGK